MDPKRCFAALLVLLFLFTGACGPKQSAEAIQPIEIVTMDTAAPTLVPVTAAPTAEPAAQELVVAATQPQPGAHAHAHGVAHPLLLLCAYGEHVL